MVKWQTSQRKNLMLHIKCRHRPPAVRDAEPWTYLSDTRKCRPQTALNSWWHRVCAAAAAAAAGGCTNHYRRMQVGHILQPETGADNWKRETASKKRRNVSFRSANAALVARVLFLKTNPRHAINICRTELLTIIRLLAANYDRFHLRKFSHRFANCQS